MRPPRTRCWIGGRGLSRVHIIASVEGSLRRLRTDYIDLYEIHSRDVATPLEETVRAMDYLVRAGKVRHPGASSFTPSQVDRAVMLSRMNDWVRVGCLQPEYSLLVRSRAGRRDRFEDLSEQHATEQAWRVVDELEAVAHYTRQRPGREPLAP